MIMIRYGRLRPYKRTSYNLTRYQLNVHGWHNGVRRHITFCPCILECQNSTLAYAVIVHGEAMFLMIIAILTVPPNITKVDVTLHISTLLPRLPDLDSEHILIRQ